MAGKGDMDMECLCCGRDTIIEGYMFRVTNSRFDTLYLSNCIVSCINYMEGQKHSASTSVYKVEVIKIGE